MEKMGRILYFVKGNYLFFQIFSGNLQSLKEKGSFFLSGLTDIWGVQAVLPNRPPGPPPMSLPPEAAPPPPPP
jgi:hypothetical protein